MSGARQQSLDSPGLFRYGLPELRQGTAPAAATDYTKTVDGRYFARLITVRATFATDANAANREVTLQYLDQSGNVYCVAGAPVTIPASQTYSYTFSAFQPEAVWPIDTGIVVPLSPVLLRPTDSFRLHIVNAQAADALTAIRYMWEMFYSDSPVPG